jgi:hypothetical protein
MKERLQYGELVHDVLKILRWGGSVDDLKSRVNALLTVLAGLDGKVTEIAVDIDGWLAKGEGDGSRKPYVAVIPPTDNTDLVLTHAAAEEDSLAFQSLLLDSS